MGFENYEDFSVARASALAVLQTIPVVGGLAQVADAVVVEKARRVQQERFDTFLDELESGASDLTREVALSEPWLRACYVTIEAVLRTDRKEKVRWFARLLLSGIGEKAQYNIAREHEDYLKLLDDLTYREIAILTLLAEFDRDIEVPQVAGSDFIRQPYWEQFRVVICQELSIPPEEVDWVLARLVRTGTYTTDIGGMKLFGHQPSGQRGLPTPLYYKLAELVQLNQWQFTLEDRRGETPSSE